MRKRRRKKKMKKRSNLQWCGSCKENCAIVKVYMNGEGRRKRVFVCMNKGCGCNEDMPFVEEVVKRDSGI